MVYSMLKNDYKIYRFKNEAIIYDMFRNEVDDIRDVELLRFSNDHIYLADIKQQSILEYTASYGDLVQCIDNDVNVSKKHFIDFGLQEGRDITFNPYLYLGSYDDLRHVFGSDKDSATRHYIPHGFREGRNPGFMYRDDSMQHSFSLSEKSQEHKYTSTFFDPKEDLSENFFEWPNSFQDTILDFSEWNIN